MKTFPLVMMVLLAGVLFNACSSATERVASNSVPVQVPVEPAAIEPASSPNLTFIKDRSQVCMVTDKYLGRPQIPVVVEGSTYYGCCEMCKGRLTSEPATRWALDPLSGKSVDKAKAIIGSDRSGSILYFESADNFSAYARQQKGG